MTDWMSANRRSWDRKTPVHAKSDFYDVEAFLSGTCSLKPAELDALGDVRGKTLLHLQCHFGLDTMSWARRGATATGVDFSGESIALAQRYAAQLKLDARFIEANIYDLSQHLDEQFDIVFTSYGALPWLPDLKAWAGLVERYLKPGGTFFIVEFHPVMEMLNWQTLAFQYDYFTPDTPNHEEAVGTYADYDSDVAIDEYFWNHGVAEVMQSLIEVGLRVETFEEFPYSYYKFFPAKQLENGFYVFDGVSVQIPMMYALKMVKI